jgi:hypothetical protein
MTETPRSLMSSVVLPVCISRVTVPREQERTVSRG